MRFLGRALTGVFLLSLTLGLFALAGVTVFSAVQDRLAEEPRQRPAREQIFAVNVVTVAPEEITPVLSAFGEVQSRRTLVLRASAGGVVSQVSAAFEDGGTVAAGDVLVRIDPAEAEAALARVMANLREAEDGLADAERGLALARDELVAAEDQARLRERALVRQRDLLARGVGTAAAVETAELAVSSAAQAVLVRRQAVAQAEARLDQAETGIARVRIDVADAGRDLEETVIRAPFGGTLTGVTLVPGERVAANAELGRLVDPEMLEAAVRISTAQYARLLDAEGRLIGASARVRLDVGGVDLEADGRIARESAAVAEGQTGRQLFVTLEGARGFRPGDFVTVAVEEPPLGRVARLPAAALSAQDTVLALGADDRLEEVRVNLLRRQGDDVIVRAPELTGRRVVAERTPLLGAGLRVRPIQQGAAEVPEAPEMVVLDPERRARLIAFVEGNQRMPAEAKARVLAQLSEEQVPARMVARIEQRMGG